MAEEEAKPTVIVLTLEQHKDGVWITRLVESFSSLSRDVLVSIVTLESLLADLDPSTAHFSSCSLLINRVSDAASPHLQKACNAILQLAASVYEMPVWSGPASYTLCCNKWCQHVLFAQAKLESPSTRALFNANQDTLKEAMNKIRGGEEGASVLLKPNAGGFGAGVKRIGSTSEISEHSLEHTVANYADHMTLIQRYVESDAIYRVWFLCGKVQCGIVRENTGDNEFTSACMARVCTLRKSSSPTIRAYTVPNDVRVELEKQLLPLIPDAHSGSVEFLHNSNGKRLYFDLNLLSTLPLVDQVQGVESVWGSNYDPWKELASAMVDMIP